MEELRSTEILDKEIQEDARKKADKIVKNSQKEAQKNLNICYIIVNFGIYKLRQMWYNIRV